MKFIILKTISIFLVLVICLYLFKQNNQPILSPLADYQPKTVYADEPIKEYFGSASWYGTGENECLGCSKNRIMANGKKLDDNKLTVECGLKSSCKYLKMGTKILITNLDNLKQVEAVVTDKGGLREDRLIDVSKEVKRQLEMKGIGKVKFSIIKQ